ncbi:hypothetical protein [Ramlibacter sp.]|uniref:hypothetical protein n=1 Tax=Ramlibacter sp. TaxID=1917967 RepID=UPI003D120F2A
MVRSPGGTETVATTDRDVAIEAARLRYSQDAERELVEDVTWEEDGYLGPLPLAWTDGSYVKQAEYPIGERPAALISLEVYVTPSERLLVVENALDAGATVRVTFAAEHFLQGGDEPADTVPQAHREAVASYAASLLCAQLAAQFSGERDATVGADGASTDSRSRNFAARAKEYRAAYYAGIGKADPRADKNAGTGDAAASASAWAGRRRNSLTTGAA